MIVNDKYGINSDNFDGDDDNNDDNNNDDDNYNDDDDKSSKIYEANIISAILTYLLTRSDPARSTINSLLTKKM